MGDHDMSNLHSSDGVNRRPVHTLRAPFQRRAGKLTLVQRRRLFRAFATLRGVGFVGKICQSIQRRDEHPDFVGLF